MKSILTIAILGMITLSSCTKDYSCSCTETDVYDGETDVYTYTYTVEGASKKESQAACNEATIKYVEGADSYSIKCELSK